MAAESSEQTEMKAALSALLTVQAPKAGASARKVEKAKVKLQSAQSVFKLALNNLCSAEPLYDKTVVGSTAKAHVRSLKRKLSEMSA